MGRFKFGSVLAWCASGVPWRSCDREAVVIVHLKRSSFSLFSTYNVFVQGYPFARFVMPVRHGVAITATVHDEDRDTYSIEQCFSPRPPTLTQPPLSIKPGPFLVVFQSVCCAILYTQDGVWTRSTGNNISPANLFSPHLPVSCALFSLASFLIGENIK